MKEKGVFHFWGPLLFRIKVSAKDVDALKHLSSQARLNQLDYRKNLAGVIAEELEVDQRKYTNIVQPYLDAYLIAHKTWYSTDVKKIKTDTVWVNYMVKGEHNPPHTHTDCDLSSVLYLEMPPDLKKEHKKFKGNGPGPGAIDFFIGGPQPFYNNLYSFYPDVGDFFIFPWSLIHYVGSFTCRGTRVSIAANFNISTKRFSGEVD